MKRFIKIFSIVLMLLVLVGCAEQKVHMDVTNSDVTVELTDIVNSSVREESQVAQLKAKYESLGYTVKEYDGTEDDMVGVICTKKFKLADVSSENSVEFHLETLSSEELKAPKFFKAEKELFGTTYRATMTYDTKKAVVEGFTAEELEENADSIEISYTVTLPSKAKSHNADSVQDNTYTWNITYGETKEINYVFKTVSPLLYIVIAVAVLTVVAVVVLVVMKVMKNKKNNIQQPTQPVTQPLNNNENNINPGYVIPTAESNPVEQPVNATPQEVVNEEPIVNDVQETIKEEQPGEQNMQ